jgi:BirA family biotin operon repressor/biotin-[acetyl-CoA-carboxylase] ligase
LSERVRSGEIDVPTAVLSHEQSDGMGSRENSWEGGRGNFFASIAVRASDLPEDLPLSSASIYFAFIMRNVLRDAGYEVWLKWPNDIYFGDEKVGGVITQKIRDFLVCGIGVNLKNSQNGFASLQSDIAAEELLEIYLAELLGYPSWKQIFSEYRLEFVLSKRFSVHIGNYEKSLREALLCEDGSISIEGKRVFSLR